MRDLYAHLNLAIGAPRRLALLKKALAETKERNPNAVAHSWQDVRYATFGSDGRGLYQGQNGDEPVWYTQGGEQFRREWFCDELPDGPRIDHTGWFCDEYQEERARGIVALLPHGRFIAGYWMSMNDERVYFGTVYDNGRDAALAADEHARVIAEQETEYSARYNAASKLADDIESGKERLRECVALRNHPRFEGRMREEARELIDTIRDKQQKLETDYKGVL